MKKKPLMSVDVSPFKQKEKFVVFNYGKVLYEEQRETN
ncbi:hypothetical protein QY97_00618 [Bacillus thermotolerans]|uniref:Uncharacterized protein n=1 Tax=Bacillus thermotolerans TaxID=1221996 RepID=A0A0F5I4H1_BACTR|nr:hypothetical protein QY96_03385 [Bacillus thermotolerans]KKB37057.1 hypothetical protein QY97_00618 [Bacillus thermotolerans]KKB40017.1 hypothetical protein QY95_01889 [Bacillus thermotolerans]